MILTLVALGIAVAATVTLAIIVWRKLPTLLTLDAGKLPKHQVDQKKRRILEARVDRRLKAAEAAVTALARPAWTRVQGWFARIVDRVHRKAATTKAPSPVPTIESALTVSDLLANAAEHAQASRWEALEAACLEILKHDPANLDAYRYLGQSTLAREQYAEAKEVYAYLEKRGVADAAVYQALGAIAVHQYRREDAERAHGRAVAMEPDEPEYRLNLAEARIKFGDAVGAFEAAADALRLAPNNPRVIDHYIRVALAAKKPGFAEDGVKQLKAVNPENAKISEYRAAIQQELDTLPRRRRR